MEEFEKPYHIDKWSHFNQTETFNEVLEEQFGLAKDVLEELQKERLPMNIHDSVSGAEMTLASGDKRHFVSQIAAIGRDLMNSHSPVRRMTYNAINLLETSL